MVLRAGRGQLGCQFGFKMGLKGQVEPEIPTVGPGWAQKDSELGLVPITRYVAQVFKPILNPSWAILGQAWPFPREPKGAF